ncbi:TonB-dependent receptor plug domain-containing protein [Chitinimonas taiwanensis]|uniref:TonB-dependent receptor plug domain-containing protein n=1 Tax=Chitinimonas taiwanensis TaxID=240412 RepID=UPI0035AFDFC6
MYRPLSTPLILCLATLVWADTPPQQTERIEVHGRLDERKQSTAAKLVIQREELLRFGDQHAVDALRRQPGISIVNNGGRGSEVRLRGLGNGYTQILLNGEPAPQGFSLDNLALEQVEKIEILRSASAEHSAQAIAGSVNVVLRRQLGAGQRSAKLSAQTIHGRPAWFADASLSDKHADFSYQLGLGASQEQLHYPMQLALSGQDAGGPLQRTTEKTEHYDNRALSLSPRLGWRLDAERSLSLDSQLRLMRGDSWVWDRRSGFGTPPDYAANRLGIAREGHDLRSRLLWAHKPDGGSSSELKLGLNDNRRDTRAHFLGYGTDGQLLSEQHVTSLAEDRAWSLDGKLRSPLGDGHALVVGWDGEWRSRDEDRLQTEQRFDAQAAENLDERYQSSVRRLALYAQDEWEISANWSSYFGLRWEGLHTRSGGAQMDAVRQRSSVFSPVLQSLWKLGSDERLRLALARTYKAPNAREIQPRRYVANDNSALTPNTQGNPQLRPELAWGLDGAWERDLSGGQFSLSAHARRIKDVVLPRVLWQNGAWVEVRENRGRATSWGLESDGRLNLRRRNARLADLDLRANVGLNYSRVAALAGADSRLDQQVPWSVNLGSDWRPDGWPLGLGFNYAVQGSAWAQVSELRRLRAAGSRTLDVYALWRLHKDAQLRLSVADALDRDKLAEARFRDADNDLYQSTRDTGRRALRLALELKL